MNFSHRVTAAADRAAETNDMRAQLVLRDLTPEWPLSLSRSRGGSSFLFRRIVVTPTGAGGRVRWGLGVASLVVRSSS